jgi:eukaryotic-like serine/threonine-protein kinase
MQAPPGSRKRAFLCAATAIVAVVILATPASASWMQFHSGPARLGVSYQSSLTSSNIKKLHVRWSAATGKSAAGINSSAAVVDGRVFVGSDDDNLYAFSTGGSRLWMKQIGGDVRSSPAVSNGIVYVGSDGGYVQARRVRDGSLVWSHRFGKPVTSSPLIAEGRVYIGGRNGEFMALNAKTGKLVWKRSVWAVWDGAAYRNDTVYVASDQSRVWAFDADTGAKRWIRDVRGRARGTPAVTDTRVFVGTDSGRLYALARKSGRVLWSSAVVAPGNGYVRCAPAVANGLVVVSVGLTTNPMDGKLRAYSVRNGALRWTGEMGDYSTSSPAFVNGMWVVGSFDHRLYAFGSNGGLLWNSGWQYQGGFFDRGISASPAIVGDTIYVGSRDGRMYALSLPR